MGDDAEYEIERLEEERKWKANHPTSSDMSHLIDAIVDSHIPAGKSRKPGEPRIEHI